MKVLVVLILTAVCGAAAFLATWEMPAPSQRVERVIPNERFAR